MDLDFSIVIPVYNRAQEIRRCVESARRLDYPPERYEVLAVDNGSTDATARAAGEAGARVVSEAEPNRSRARNAGAAAARGRWLAFTDSDCEVEAGWLRALMEAIEAAGDGEVGVLAGAIENGPPRSTVEAYIAHRGWLDQEKFLAEGRRFSDPFAAAANLCVRHDVFEAVGGFDPAMPPAEDADWCWRAADAGWPVRYVPGARVVHHHRATLGGMMRQAYGYGAGNAALFAKHRARWGAARWIDPRWAIWAAKGLVKAPFGFALGRTPLARRMAWYDFLANGAQAWGRVRGGWRRGATVL